MTTPKPAPTFDEYSRAVESERDRQPYWRAGQTAFNVLWMMRPDLSEQVRGGLLDPFHRSDLMPAFYEWVKEHWND